MIRTLVTVPLGYLRSVRPRGVSKGEIRRIVATHNREGGCTVSLRKGNLAGRPYFAVSPYPERTERIAGRKLTDRMVRRFIERNMDLLQDHRHSVGTWFFEDGRRIELDVVVTVRSRVEAVAIGRESCQIAVYDLARNEEIAL